MSVKQHTDTEDVEAESLIGGLVDQLVWEAVKTNVACQREWPESLILNKNNTHAHTHKICFVTIFHKIQKKQ